MHFAAFEGLHPAASETEFRDYVKHARQGDPGAEAALRLTISYATAPQGVMPDYVREYLAKEYAGPRADSASHPPNASNNWLRDQNLVLWIDTARYVRDAAKCAPNVETWAEAQHDMPTARTSNEEIYRSASKRFGISAKTTKNIYLAAKKDRTRRAE